MQVKWYSLNPVQQGGREQFVGVYSFAVLDETRYQQLHLLDAFVTAQVKDILGLREALFLPYAQHIKEVVFLAVTLEDVGEPYLAFPYGDEERILLLYVCQHIVLLGERLAGDISHEYACRGIVCHLAKALQYLIDATLYREYYGESLCRESVGEYLNIAVALGETATVIDLVVLFVVKLSRDYGVLRSLYYGLYLLVAVLLHQRAAVYCLAQVHGKALVVLGGVEVVSKRIGL